MLTDSLLQTSSVGGTVTGAGSVGVLVGYNPVSNVYDSYATGRAAPSPAAARHRVGNGPDRPGARSRGCHRQPLRWMLFAVRLYGPAHRLVAQSPQQMVGGTHAAVTFRRLAKPQCH